MSHHNHGEEQIPKLSVRFYEPITQIIGKISEAFEEKGDLLEVTGFPMKVFCFRDPEHCQQILTHKVVGETKFPGLLPRVKFAQGKGAYILRGGKAWRTKRHQIQPAFNQQALADYCKFVPELTQNMFDRWKLSSFDTGKTMDIYGEMRRLIIEINLKALFGENAEDILPELEKNTHHINQNFAKFIPTWLPLRNNLIFRNEAESVRKVMLRTIQKQRINPSGKKNVVSLLLSLKDEKGCEWSNQEIVDEMLSIYYGFSVMGTTLAWALYLFATHPEVREKLAAETNKVLEGRTPAIEEVERIPYAQMIIDEILRLYPASWGYPRHNRDGMTIGGRYIPGSSIVIPMVYHTHRDPKLWDNPSLFNPERFSPEKRAAIHPFAFYPFGGGVRACLGTNLAPKILKIILVMIAANYRMELRPRFISDPIADFGFEIGPKESVFVALFPTKQSANTNPEKVHHA